MRSLDADEREAMREALQSDHGACPDCGSPNGDGQPFPKDLTPALWRCAKRGLVRFHPCGGTFNLHFEATALGRLVFHLSSVSSEAVG